MLKMLNTPFKLYDRRNKKMITDIFGVMFRCLSDRLCSPKDPRIQDSIMFVYSDSLESVYMNVGSDPVARKEDGET